VSPIYLNEITGLACDLPVYQDFWGASPYGWG